MSDTDKRPENDTADEQNLADETLPTEEMPEGEASVEPPTDEEVAEHEPPTDEEVAKHEPPPAKARGRGIAWIALIVSAAALAAVAYTIFLDWRSASDDTAVQTIAVVQRQLNESREELANLDALVAEIAGRDLVSAADIDAITRDLEKRVDLVNSLPARMSALESSVASLAGISAGARDTWLLAEAEYYMQIANAQLQLANNPRLASLALAMADERVVQLANPALTDVRSAIADELAALDVMEKPDIAGTAMTLASLARVVESLPVRSGPAMAEDTPGASGDEQSGMQRAWTSVKGAMSGLVKVTPPDQARLALLTPDAEYFLRNNIALQLQAARLALLRGELAIFEQSVDGTNALLLEYFDTESTPVAGALRTLEEIRGNIVVSSAPDISGSLQLLRQYQALRENSQ